VALSDQWTLNQLTTLCSNELLDPRNAWFPQAELQIYINEWQQRLQDWYEFVWATGTTAVASIGTITNSDGLIIPAGTASITLNTFLPSQVRIDAFYWISSTATAVDTLGYRLTARTKQDLNILIRDWRYALPQDPPLVVYQDDITDIVLWPAPANAGTLIAEFPAIVTLPTGTSTMTIPAWTKYSCRDYVASRCYLRTGPRQDIQKAMTYKASWDRAIKRFRRQWDNYLPERYPSLKPLQPSDHYSIDILNPPQQTIITVG
jgi:hypothetical protein